MSSEGMLVSEEASFTTRYGLSGGGTAAEMLDHCKAGIRAMFTRRILRQ